MNMIYINKNIKKNFWSIFYITKYHIELNSIRVLFSTDNELLVK